MLAPSVSPDGRWVAWTWLGRDPVRLRLCDRDRRHRRAPGRLTFGPDDAAVESWSADNQRLILALTDGGDEKVRLHIVAVEGGAEPRLLTDPAPDYYIVGGDLHPNGRWLVYAANVAEDGQPTEATRIHRQDIEDRRAPSRWRAPRGPADTRPRLNRPGSHVVYGRSDRHPAGQTLWLVDIEGQRGRRDPGLCRYRQDIGPPGLPTVRSWWSLPRDERPRARRPLAPERSPPCNG
jgi:Tol biopolymer transport system component